MVRVRRLLVLTGALPLLVALSGCGGDEGTPLILIPTATATSIPSATPSVRPSATESVPTPTASATSPPATATPVPTPTATTAAVSFYRAPVMTDPSGPRGDGSAVLPNGRIVTPVGRQATVATLPLNVRVGPSGHVFVTNDGNGNDDLARYLQVIDPQTLQVRRTSSQHFFGLAVHPDGQRVYVANGPADQVDVFAFDGTTLSPVGGAAIQFPSKTFPMGLDLSADGATLFVVGFLSNTFWRVDLASGATEQAAVKIGNFPYTVIATRDGRRAYVSSWGLNNGNPTSLIPVPLPPTDPNNATRSSVAVLDTSTSGAPSLVRYVPIARSQRVDSHANIFGGSHPTAMALSPDGTRLYVTATNLDLLVVIDTATNEAIAEIDLNVFGDGLQGVYPDAIAVSADGRRIYVADAGINAVQVIDTDVAQRTFTPQGFIPTGWYPSALAMSADGATLYVASAKGLNVGGNGAELVDISTTTLGATPYYIGRIIKGMMSAIDLGAVDLGSATAAVRANNGVDPVALSPAELAQLRDNPVPIEFGAGPSPQIKYVVYILKENRTYDQVLGDFGRGNGEPRLTLFGADVTPNTHAIAEQFAIGDNFYDDAEVSYPGHEWITQGNNNDWVEKIWPFEYNNLLSPPFSITIESGQEGFCKNGFIFEALERQHVPFRVYGEPLAFNSRLEAGIDGGGTGSTLRKLLDAFGSIDSLAAHVGDLLAGNVQKLRDAGVNVDLLTTEVWPNLKLDYPSNILPDKTDVFRADLFKAELAQFTTNNNLPNFLFIWLPNDHTFGALPNHPTTRSAVADNDQGLGMVVEALTQSPFWPQMAIFVSEDDAQDGQDHVSAHRTLSLVLSPYARRGYISPVHHSNVSMLKTMELLLGVQPMSQYDRYATDMRDYFTTTADRTPFAALAARVRSETNLAIDAQPNPLLREAAAVSSELNFSAYDEAGPELSRVLWLVHVGEQLEAQRRRAVIGTTAMAAMLVLAGVLIQRRRRLAQRTA